jgi:beta-lactamase class A
MRNDFLLKQINRYFKRLPCTIGLAVRTFSGKECLINAHRPWVPESIIKLAVLVEAFESLDLEKMVRLPRHRVGGWGVLQFLSSKASLSLYDLVNLMIIVSDNVATNAVLGKINMERANKKLKSMGLRRTEIHRGLCLPRSKTTGTKENVTTPYDTMLLLEYIRKRPKIRDLLANQLDKSILRRYLPKDVKCYSKSGEGKYNRHDCGILTWKHGGAVIVLFSRHKSPIKSLKRLYSIDSHLAEIASMAYRWARSR